MLPTTVSPRSFWPFNRHSPLTSGPSIHLFFLTLVLFTLLAMSAQAESSTATSSPSPEATSPPALQRASLSILSLLWSFLYGLLLAVWTVVTFFTRPFTRFIGFILRIAVYEPSSLVISLSWAALPIISFFILAILLGVAAGSGAAWITGPDQATLTKSTDTKVIPKVRLHKPSSTVPSSSPMTSSARDQEMLREVEDRMRARKSAAAAAVATSIEEEVNCAPAHPSHRPARRDPSASTLRPDRRHVSEGTVSSSAHLDTDWDEFDSALEEAESFFSRIGHPHQGDSSSLDASSL
ncbi:hypothetical protein BJ684DRAFT_20686 [Piptocephalis cylindrospora]|uniref:Uncharacterized protein n=1 Tax=Piptocephalis cylindrospora TaxID=1907219 RepID=A0A4P9Y211_9FUNG|nr:hypothetical protein BJ684DRAFT_20686 [Piptocephalis cylindrospora]|eukprot:RKP12793.1 hypothetical protein BJ684DRAFT_20686 [Piptocephalis cylindrospora]